MKSPIVNFVVFDTETGGLSAEKNSVLEIACCSFDINLNDGPEYESGIMKVYDNREVTAGALNANGITMSQVLSGRDPETVLNEFIKYLSSMCVGRNKPVLCGHNIDSFDVPFLLSLFKFFGKDLTKYANEEFTIDTMWWARTKWPESVNYRLGTCVENAGFELVNAHRALNDTRANRDLVKHFITSLRFDGATTSTVEEKKYRETFQF